MLICLFGCLTLVVWGDLLQFAVVLGLLLLTAYALLGRLLLIGVLWIIIWSLVVYHLRVFELFISYLLVLLVDLIVGFCTFVTC